MKNCALTGHRDLMPDFDEYALHDALETLIRSGYDGFLCGMARGFDLTALSHLMELKKKYPLFLEACIPFAGHDRSFSQRDRALYRTLLEGCDRKTVIFPHYTSGCYLVRDRYMVDGADALFAYCVKEKGGAAYTAAYAKKRGIPVFLFPE